MGATFTKTYIRMKNSPIDKSRIAKAAKDISYTLGAKGKGVPVQFHFYKNNYDWLLLKTPVFDAENEAAAAFAAALSRELKTPLLRIACCDSDFAVCRLIDGVNGRKTNACINKPYDDIALDPLTPALWMNACKKNWNCKEKQFEEVFGADYIFAEDGLRKLAKLIHLPAETIGADEETESEYTIEFWIIPQKEFEKTPFPRTPAEIIAAHLEEKAVKKLIDLGYKKYDGSVFRWHKVFGEEGKEMVASVCVAVRNGYEVSVCSGVQALCCPFAVTKMESSIDHLPYFYSATTVFPFFMLNQGNEQVERKLPGLLEWISSTVLAELERQEAIKDFSSLRQYTETMNRECLAKATFGHALAYRTLVEAILNEDEQGAAHWAEKTAEMQRKYAEMNLRIEAQTIPDLPLLYQENGFSACFEALGRVRNANMKKLAKGGIV